MLPADIFDQVHLNDYGPWHANFSWAQPSAGISTRHAVSIPNHTAHRWPLHTNLIAIPRIGAFAYLNPRFVRMLQS
jgi:hypothetical protein